MFHVNDMDAFFDPMLASVVDWSAVSKRHANGALLDPHFPFCVHVLTPEESHQELYLRSKPDRLSPGIIANRLTHKTKLVDHGLRNNYDTGDIQVWLMYNWIRDMVTHEKEGCFLDDDSRIPHVKEFMPPFRPPLTLGPVDSEAAKAVAYLQYQQWGPCQEVKNMIKNWFDRERLTSIKFSNSGHFQICQGELNTILAYYAYKENVRPPCLAPMF